MEQTFGDKLKQVRTNRGLKQSELAKHLGVTNTTISNWEKNVSKPDLDMLSYICGILSVKASYFLSPTLPDDEISIPEFQIIKKYRSLDDPGRTHIDSVLDWEVERSAQLREATDRIGSLEPAAGRQTPIPLARDPAPDYLAVNAAHARTDLSDSEITPELAQLEEAIMDDENF